MVETIRRIQDVRVGDIFLGPIGGAIGAGIALAELVVDGGFRVGTVDVRHAGIVTRAEPGIRFTAEYPNGIMDTFELAQAMPKGAEVTSMTYDRHWTDRCLYVRLPEDYPGQAQDAATIALAMVTAGVDYSFFSYPALGAWRWGVSTPKLEAWIGRRRDTATMVESHAPLTGGRRGVLLPEEAICSVFVDQAWSLTGKKIFQDGRPHQCVTPSQLAQRLIQMEGNVLGWPTFYPLDPEL